MLLILNDRDCKVVLGGQDLLVTNLEELRDYFRVTVPNYWFSDLYKEGKWDGTKTYIDRSGKCMLGFVPHIIKWAEQEGLEVKINDMRTMQVNFIRTSTHIGEDKLRDYQLVARGKAENYIQDIPFHRGIFDCATNTGKNYIMSSIITDTDAPTIFILFHLRDLFEQAIEYFEQYFEVGTIGAKKDREGRVMLCMYKTLSNRVKTSKNVLNMVKEAQMLFVDEGHRAKGKDYFDIIQQFNAPSVYFMSGTPLQFDNDEDKFRVIGLSGQTLHKITNKDLIEKGVSLKPTVFVHTLEGYTGISYRDTYDLNYTNGQQITEKIYKECISDDKFVLIAVIKIEHAKNIQRYFQSKGFEIDILSGKSTDRKDVLKDFKEGKVKWLITTMVIKEGLNLPTIQTLILAFGGKSEITIKQIIGRALRTNGVDSEVKIVDFAHKCPYLSAHGRARLKLYKAEEFEIKML